MENFGKNEGELKKARIKKPLSILKTNEDKLGTDIDAMSNFFEGYIEQKGLELRDRLVFDDKLGDLSTIDIGIIDSVVRLMNPFKSQDFVLIPDYDSIPKDIRTKLDNGIWNLGESRQVDGNVRAVIVDEGGVRRLDVTLKKVQNNVKDFETMRHLENQMQLRKINIALESVQNLQKYAMKRDRDRDIKTPFIDAITLVRDAETVNNENKRLSMLKRAADKVTSALNSVYGDMDASTEALVNVTQNKKRIDINECDVYIGCLKEDIQYAMKFVGMRIQLLECIGQAEAVKLTLSTYLQEMHKFCTKPITKKGLSATQLMHEYYPYDKNNLNFWYNYEKEIIPKLESCMQTLQLCSNDDYSDNVYVVTMEDVNNG